MIVECPQCRQRIDLGGGNLSSFACPVCQTCITLEVTAVGASQAASSTSATNWIPHPSASPSAPTSKGKAEKPPKIGFNLLGWLFAVVIVGPLMGKCAQKIIAPDYDPEEFQRMFGPQYSEPDFRGLREKPELRRFQLQPPESP